MTQGQSRAAYLVAFALLIFVGGLLGSFKNPYGKDFFRVVLPGLLVLNALPWIALSVKARWRAVGALCSLLMGLPFLVWSRFLVSADLANFSTVFLLAMFAHGAALWHFAADPVEKGIVLSQHIAIVFVVLLGFDLNVSGVASQLGTSPTATAGFLFWSPLAAAFLWTVGTSFKREGAAQVMLVLAIVQTGIGLWDLRSMWHLRWGLPSAFVAWFAALGIAGFLAKRWASS